MPNAYLTLPSTTLSSLARSWLLEDCPGFDVAAACLPATQLTAVLYVKSHLVLAGGPFFTAVFRELGCHVKWLAEEGTFFESSGKRAVARVSGQAAELLRGERPALNALSEVAGVATAAHIVMQNVRNWDGKLAMTRKTPPGLRLLHKYGAIVGGMDPHRYDLGTPMLKDNHIKASGGVANSLSAVRAVSPFTSKIDVEVASLSEALSACEAGADIVMLDNFSCENVRETVQVLKRQFPNVIVEVSGGITPQNVQHFMIEGVDVISFSISKYAAAVDFSLKIEGNAPNNQ